MTLFDPPLLYHLPQKAWVRLDKAIDEISSIRLIFVDWLEYGLEDIEPRCSLLDLDIIDINAGELRLSVDGSGLLSGPPAPNHPHLELYNKIERCVRLAQINARDALSDMIKEGLINIYARKHEQDADLQLMPPYVWSATEGNREHKMALATLPSGKSYFDIHVEIILRPTTSSSTKLVEETDPPRNFLSTKEEIMRLIKAMEAAAPNLLKKEKAKALLGYHKDQSKKRFDAVWKAACQVLNQRRDEGVIKFAGRYGVPSGNPSNMKT